RCLVTQVFAEAGPGEPVLVFQAPARLYPSFEWYLRQHPGRALWGDDFALVSGASRFWCLCFRTRAGTEAPLQRSQRGFVLVSRRVVWLDMGPEADATMVCEVQCWQCKDEPEGKPRLASTMLEP